jgi:anti-sigma B factor antagonist
VLEISTSPGSTTITVIGDLDVTAREQFPEATARVATLGRQLLVLDLCRMDFMDSTGAAFVAVCGETTRRGGGVALLRGADEHAAFVLEICGVLELFRLDETHSCHEDSPVPA